MSLFEIREEELSVAEVIAAVTRPEAGGISVFVGTVRSDNAGHAVTLLEYQAYASMAAKEMARIGAEISSEIPGVELAVLHRVGSLTVGQIAVVCAASAPHRGEAFTACRLLIDRIKARVPIWKREHGPSGPYWVGWEDARCSPDGDAHGHAHHGEHEQ
jgi:molybdopterin synthase catalytic subunit